MIFDRRRRTHSLSWDMRYTKMFFTSHAKRFKVLKTTCNLVMSNSNFQNVHVFGSMLHESYPQNPHQLPVSLIRTNKSLNPSRCRLDKKYTKSRSSKLQCTELFPSPYFDGPPLVPLPSFIQAENRKVGYYENECPRLRIYTMLIGITYATL